MRSFFLFILLLSSSFALDASFGSGLTNFNTDMQLDTGFTLQVDEANVVDGNPNNLQAGDTVCSGATVTINPTTTTRWATSYVNIEAPYPDCVTAGCPAAMVDYPNPSLNKAVAWISESEFTDHDTFGDQALYIYSDQDSRYYDLGTFYAEPATYFDLEGTHTGKRIDGNVFCKGDLAIRADQSSVATYHMPNIQSPPAFTIDGEGDYTITTALTNVECFAAAAKYPLEADTLWFIMYYYTVEQPTISESESRHTITLNVAESGGNCELRSIREQDITVSDFDDASLVSVLIRNAGDTAEIIEVGAGSGYSAVPFPTSLCTGLPSSICPSSNGFDEPINPGSSKTVHVYVEETSGSGGTTLVFAAQTIGAVCGGVETCNTDTGTHLQGALSCEIDPPEFEHKTYMGADYYVTCHDLGGGEVPCSGNNWYWDGISGEFVERTNTHADTYVTSPAGTSGTLNYESDNIAHCQSQVNVTDEGTEGNPFYQCEFIPSEIELNYSDEQYFELNCFRNDEHSTPEDADYDIINGLIGDKTDESPEGVTFIAGEEDSSGNLRGRGFWSDIEPPHNSAYAIADITVGNGSDIPPGGTDYLRCEFDPPSAELEIGDSEYFELNCYENDIPSIPDDVDYSVIDGLDGYTTGGSTGGVTFVATGNSTGNLRGHAIWDHLPEPNNTADTTALITIGDGGPGGEDVPPGGGGDDPYDGSSEWCTIDPITNVFPDYFGYVGIRCGPDADQPCNNVYWYPSGEVILNEPQNDHGTHFTVTGIPGEEGFIHANIDGDPAKSCFRGFRIGTPECWEFA